MGNYVQGKNLNSKLTSGKKIRWFCDKLKTHTHTHTKPRVLLWFCPWISRTSWFLVTPGGVCDGLYPEIEELPSPRAGGWEIPRVRSSFQVEDIGSQEIKHKTVVRSTQCPFTVRRKEKPVFSFGPN